MREFIWSIPNGVSQVVMCSQAGMFGRSVFGVKSAENGRGMAGVQGQHTKQRLGWHGNEPLFERGGKCKAAGKVMVWGAEATSGRCVR